MDSVSVFLMAFAVLGVSAKPQSNTYKIINSGCGSSIPAVKTHICTSVVENPTMNFPSFIPPSTVTQSCHCLRTIVRPQIHNEIITVPTVDRLVRTVATPIVETVDCSGSAPLGTFTQQSILPGVIANRNVGGVFQNDISTLNGNNSGLFGKENSRSYSTCHSSNSANGGSLIKSNGISSNVISPPSVSAFQNMNKKNFRSSAGTIFSGNAGYLNNGRIVGF